MIKCFLEALYDVEVQIKMLSRLFGAKTKKAPIKIQNGRCHLVMLGIKQIRVLTALLGTHHGVPIPSRQRCSTLPC